MNPDELRALADALEPMSSAPRFEGMNVLAFCKWLRAQAEPSEFKFQPRAGALARSWDRADALAEPKEENNVWKQIIPDDVPQAEEIDPHMLAAEDRFPDEQAEPKREPLSDTMVIACARVAIARIQPDEWVATDADLIDFARAIESEHGIGGSDAE